ncbi:hypothetical protein ANANG_G00302400 [Anguilla anguilla]|uniref:Uncharacterized protein n=1 Tax=Anguilla anguilla TaxID=7936 RepID=A0A9D3LRD8_ANGAN|nr:hypothetical protein ANANG_G00302400 [Anguilla anguilla]
MWNTVCHRVRARHGGVDGTADATRPKAGFAPRCPRLTPGRCRAWGLEPRARWDWREALERPAASSAKGPREPRLFAASVWPGPESQPRSASARLVSPVLPIDPPGLSGSCH